MSAIDPPGKKRHGCLFYGCITLICVGLVVSLAAFFLLRYVVNITNAKIAEWTETQPMAFPKVNISEDEVKKLQDRVTMFGNAIDAHSNTAPLVLSSRDLNGLMLTSTNFKGLKDMVHVDLEGEIIKGEVSLPLEKFFHVPFVHTKGRYLNGVGTFTVGVVSNLPAVYVQSLEVKGKTLPADFMKPLRGKNMAEDFERNPTNNAPTVGHYESIEVKDGELVIQPKTN
jgi:hypothetical protein